MQRSLRSSPGRTLSRREFLGGAGASVAASVAGTGLLQALFAQGLAAGSAPAAVPARAKHCIYLFMFGGPSQMDLFDPKPELQRSHGKTIALERRRGEARESVILGSQRTFRRYGATGQWCSDALPRIAEHMDKLAVVKSLYADSFAHGSGLLQMNTGQTLQGHPSMGAWIQYGLGTQNPDLPGFVVMHDPRGGPISGPLNWSSGYMPAEFQGTLFRSGGDPLLDLSPAPTGSARSAMTRAMQAQQIELIERLDAMHAARRPGHSELTARANSYGLSYRMQAAAPEALDLSSEPAETRAMYGLDDPKGDHPLGVGPAPFGRQCLIARRLIERGVRFVQIYQGGGHQQQSWDAHHGVEENLSIHCPEIDKPVAALLTDLARTGLLDETLVIWGGEFGRMPVSQLGGAFQVASPIGRDHNPKGFCMWLAGAGVKPGSYGETDELGHEAAVNRHHVRDLHATVLHLMGLDHASLTYKWGGLERKLTGVIHAEPIRGIMA
jgi:hypothetical protein